MERRTLRGWLAAVAVTAVVATLAWWLLPDAAADAPAPSGVERVVPAGTRIRVEVLNGTNVRGMARRASLYLRDLGFDVVSYGQDSTTSRDSTVVEDHTLHPEWADLVSEHVSGSRVEPRPDSSRYVDVTVRLGASWRLPPKAFYP